MRFESITLKSFPPFADATIGFPQGESKSLAEVHLLTGQNGCGKTRLLCALEAAAGNDADLKARLDPFSESDVIVVAKSDELAAIYIQTLRKVLEIEDDEMMRAITDHYCNGGLRDRSGKILDPRLVRPIRNTSETNTISWAARRGPTAAQSYRGTNRISDQKISALAPVPIGDPISHLSLERNNSDDGIVCQSMANLKLGAAMESPGEVFRALKLGRQIIERFESAMRTVTGREFTFLVRPQPDVHLVVRWGTTSMKLSLLPDGLRSIIAWLVACVAKQVTVS
ncbi:MAG: AAA family ATPase [Planctomycetaceae bacterium]